MQAWEGGRTPWSWDLQPELALIIPPKSLHRNTLICVWLNNLEKIRGFQRSRTLGGPLGCCQDRCTEARVSMQWSKQIPPAQGRLRLWGEGGPRSWRTLIARPQRARCSEAAFFQLPKYGLSWNRKAADTGTPEAGTCQPSPVHMSHADSMRSVSRACLSNLGGEW